MLGSGLLSALATIVTVTLSIDQLILSRVFGMPADLTDRLEGNLDFRRSIEGIADVDISIDEAVRSSLTSGVATGRNSQSVQSLSPDDIRDATGLIADMNVGPTSGGDADE